MAVDGIKTGSIKSVLMKFLNTQSEDVTIEDVFDFLLTEQKLQHGRDALENGQYYTHEQAKEILQKWLK